MAQFEITARHDINRPNGFHVDRGTTFTLNINVVGITPGNLFNNTRCQDALIQQFRVNGMDIPKSDYGFYSRGTWDIKML